MKRKFTLKYFVVALMLTLVQLTFSCNQGVSTKSTSIVDSIPPSNVLSKPSATFTDTLEIGDVSAIFFNPDSMQLKKIETLNQKMIYESMTHDCFYQMRNARFVLSQHWPQVRIIETNKSRFLRFIKSDKKTTLIDLDTKNDICGILLFDKKKDPVLADMTNMDTALESYFGKQH